MSEHAPLVRVSRREPCAICGRPGWCSRSADGGLALCMRVSEGAARTASNGAHIHVLLRASDSVRRVATARIDPPPPDLRPIVAAALSSTPDDWHAALARSLSLPEPDGVAALSRLGAHRPDYLPAEIAELSPRDQYAMHALRRQCALLHRGDWAGFPMSTRDRVVGVRLRETPTSRKRALLRGREGLFLPAGLTTGADVLVICEGPTDTAALLAVGIDAIGRPSCTGAVPETVRLMLALRPRVCAVLLDRDGPGIAGGVTLARALADVVADVRCVLPPAAMKDARQWVRHGARHRDVVDAVERAQRAGAVCQ